MGFILDAVKKSFGNEGESNSDGYDDLNYMIGNSSAMDVGEVPTPLDQRIGYASQVGGSVMELQITNPSTFNLEGDEMIATIDQLGIDVTLHSDMNAGYASAQKSGQGEQYGYDTVEEYFTNYLQELAAFKKEVERRGNGEPLFHIGRINPHISTSMLPPLEERMETDVGVDPFGFTTNDYDETSRKKRNHHSQNIYKNPGFLRNLYYTLFLETASYPFQFYQTFASYSDKFDRRWKEAQHKAAEQIFRDEAKDIEEKIGAVLVARSQDQGTGTNWREVLSNSDWEMPVFRATKDASDDYDGLDRVRSMSLEDFMESMGNRPRLNFLDDSVFEIRNTGQREIAGVIVKNLSDPDLHSDMDALMSDLEDEVDLDSVVSGVIEELDDLLLKLWEDTDDEDERYMTQEAKWAGLQSHLEVKQIRLLENAYQIGKQEYGIEELAEDVFSGDDLSLFDAEDREGIDEEYMHEDLVQRLINDERFQREMWKESTIFYQIIPAWMAASSNDDHDAHKGWEAPEFIWEVLVEKWEERDDIDIDVEIDLKNVRNGVYDDNDDDTYHYMDLLEHSDEFRMDVAAATSACYAWAHFTQRKSHFNVRGRDLGLDSDEVEEVENEGWTWIDWMNRFGIGVNLESMNGSPQNKLRIFRSKDIAVAAHAINMTARQRLDEEGELGGLDHLSSEIDERPAKFTIDMEHVASLGVDPEWDMERFIEQEKELASDYSELELDSDKPIAKTLRQYHLMDPGVEGQRGTHHGSFKRGNTLIYEWLHWFVENGFARNPGERATILFELAEHKGESSYMMRLSMDMIALGVTPEELDPSNVNPGENYRSEKEALIARFFGMDRSSYDREWAKIEEHAFDPLDGLLQTEDFDNTSTGSGAIDQAGNRPMEWKSEEYK
ncbi:hypothetical protein [Candidatus Nanohalovita haloferacivicina]|uniref:hypothetical protein n=1 Tax=Candidatus Nanohalovita haloferacivicina TaxID=2978046 RepID=UPI00325FA25A|nr:hypothetical protein HBNXNv_0886 [Candidatus Nanohalobia archaeon BNXNv]